MSVVVITGATAGVGKATALRFAAAGYDVGLIARDDHSLEATRAEVANYGVNCHAVSVDVVDATALSQAAQTLADQLGTIDVWINNAMCTTLAPFYSITDDEFRRVTEVTYLGCVNGTRAAMEQMIPRDSGRLSRSAPRWPTAPFHSSRPTAAPRRRSAALPMRCVPS